MARGLSVAASTTELEALFSSATVGVALIDRDLRYVRVNEPIARINALSIEDHAGRRVAEVVREPMRERIEHAARRVFETGTAVLRQHIGGHGADLVVDYLPVRDEAGALTLVAVLAAEVTEQRRAEEALVLNLTLAQVIAEISTSFIDDESGDIDSSVRTTLELLGSSLDLDRIAICIFTPDRQAVTLTHTWHNARVPQERTAPHVLDLTHLPWMKARLERGQELVLDDLLRLPPEAIGEQALFDALGMHGAAMFPIAVGRRVDGLISFGKQTVGASWPHELIGGLRVVAEIIAGALDRRRRELEEKDRFRFQELVTQLATGFIDTPAGELDTAITGALAEVSRVLDFDQTTLYQVGTDGRLTDSHHWIAPDDPTPHACATGMTPEEVGWPLSLVVKGEVFIGDRAQVIAHHTPFDAVYERDDLRLLAAAPVVNEGAFIGFVAFLRFRRDRERATDLGARLKLVTDLLAGTLGRARADEARRRAYDELARLKASIEGERDYLREEVDRSAGSGDILGHAPSLQAALDVVDAVAPTTATVLLNGESGVGKELFARALHARSPRADRALVKVNCAAIPRELFESEFFGHVRGAFTGATKDRIGRFELADGGTLFLDEVGEIPLELQSKLLRVLQESELERVGDDRTRRIDVRVVAATNRDLERDVQAGRFRADLYYRLSVFPIRIPPLRERREDIPGLAEHFLQATARAMGRRGLSLDQAQLQRLVAYDWPGNVRELQHVMERAVILSRIPPLRIDLGPETPRAPVAPAEVAVLPPPASPGQVLTAAEMAAVERENLVQALTRSGWRIAGQSGAAELLGLAPSTLRDRMKALGIQRPR